MCVCGCVDVPECIEPWAVSRQQLSLLLLPLSLSRLEKSEATHIAA